MDKGQVELRSSAMHTESISVRCLCLWPLEGHLIRVEILQSLGLRLLHSVVLLLV